MFTHLFNRTHSMPGTPFMIDTTSQFFALLTKRGEDKEAAAIAAREKWGFAQMGVGDANGTEPIPNRLQTGLINEQYRAPLNLVDRAPDQPNVIVAELIIPPEVGGWDVRELGLYDDDGELVAVANCAPSYKPLLSQGTGKTQVVRLNFIVTSVANVLLIVDPTTVLVSRESMQQAIEVFGRDILAQIAQPEGVAEGTFRRVTVDRRGLVVEGYNPTTLEEYEIAPATQEQAEEGTDNTTPMTPLRVLQAIIKRVVQATESVQGSAKIATQEQVNEGSDDETIVTPMKLSTALSTKAPLYNPTFDGAVNVLGETLSMKCSDGTNTSNLHQWFYNADGTERALMYVDSGGTIRFRANGGPVILTLNNDGTVVINGRTIVGDIVSNDTVFSGAGAAWMAGDGNLYGLMFGGYLTDFLATHYLQRANLPNDIATYASGTGGVGTYALMTNRSGADVPPGGLVSGAQLTYTNTEVTSRNGGAASGTWRCMGLAGSVPKDQGTTLFLRIA